MHVALAIGAVRSRVAARLDPSDVFGGTSASSASAASSVPTPQPSIPAQATAPATVNGPATRGTTEPLRNAAPTIVSAPIARPPAQSSVPPSPLPAAVQATPVPVPMQPTVTPSFPDETPRLVIEPEHGAAPAIATAPANPAEIDDQSSLRPSAVPKVPTTGPVSMVATTCAVLAAALTLRRAASGGFSQRISSTSPYVHRP